MLSFNDFQLKRWKVTRALAMQEHRFQIVFHKGSQNDTYCPSAVSYSASTLRSESQQEADDTPSADHQGSKNPELLA